MQTTQLCGNGILETGEECDDGNLFNQDGCNVQCLLEDISHTFSGNTWLCSGDIGARTSCCPTRINPVTLGKVCNCSWQAAPYAGVYITDGCVLRDVDECITPKKCIGEAECVNLDASNLNGTHQCVCPPGFIGDGVTRCAFAVAVTKLKIEINTRDLGVDSTHDSIINKLFSLNVIPSSVKRSDVYVDLKPSETVP
jgi:cysteine-rich repeat protein